MDIFSPSTHLHSRVVLLKASFADVGVPSATRAVHLIRVVQSSNLILSLDELESETCEVSLAAGLGGS